MKNPMKVLLVDDEPEILKLFSRTLEREGYQVETAKSGTEGWEKYQNNYYDVVIVDWRMPGMDGMKLMQHIDGQIPRPHVIMITAYADRDSAIEAHHQHAFDYLTKPVDSDVLIDTVNKAAQRKDGIIAALESWVETHPEEADKPERASFSSGSMSRTWSAREILEEIRRNTPKGQQEYQKLVKLTVDLLTRGVIEK